MSDPSDHQERSQPSEEDEAPRFKVTDRRHFDREGNLREDVDPEDEDQRPAAEEELLVDAPAEPAAEQEPTADAGRSVGATPPLEEESAASDEASGPTLGRPPEGEAPSPGDLPRNFSALVQSMYFEALLYLGAVRHPQTGEVVEDPELAKYKIDLLGMLQDKTEGNLTPEESSELEEVLYQLRMLYMQKTKAARL